MGLVKTAVFALLAFLSFQLAAVPLTPEQVPAPLKPWIAWALRGHEDLACPFAFSSVEERRCSWLTRLMLDLTERGGRFESAIRVYADGWSTLPGDTHYWPQEVRVDGRPAIVTPEGEIPRIWLPQGAHAVSGIFRWDRLPENLTVPREAGLLALSIAGRDVPFPAFNEQGQLWVQADSSARPGQPEIENRLELDVFRRVIDEVPLQVVTRLDLRVSGLPREILLQGTLLPEFVPLSVTSPLPARVESNGSLRLQLRPGDWEIEVTARHLRPLDRLTLPALPEPWPSLELWVFDARNHLRMVQIEGVAAVDPRQTNLPEPWKQLPAYQLHTDDTLMFRLLRRGDPEPEPDRLSLNRKLWLDFDGRGLTASDAVSGKMTRDWRLDARAPLKLGRVSIDGQPQSITRLREEGAIGVEVRRGAVNLSADSRFEGAAGRLPATGWAKDFHQVHTELNLPPGWRLLAALGVDNAPDTWIGRWTLLDLFVVLIAALAAGRLWNYPAALLTLLVLSLLWHEPGAPRFVWLNLLLAIALLRVLPEGRFALGIRVYRNVCVVALMLIAIPFAYQQVRSGLYPQLEMPWLSPAVHAPKPSTPADFAGAAQAPVPAAAPSMEMESATGGEEEIALNATAEDSARRAKRYPSMPPELKRAAKFSEIDPNALTQTGPGLPRWRWRTIALSWNGPVLSGQEIRLFLLSPAANLFLNFARILLLALLAMLFLGYRWKARRAPLLLFLPLLLLVPPNAHADFPDAAMLQLLTRGFLEAPQCLPACAEIPRLKLRVTPDELQLSMEIHASERVMVPLPGQEGQWLPNQGAIDGAPVASLMRSEGGGLWLGIEPGPHVANLTGPLPQREQIQLFLPLKPRRVEVDATGWQVDGVQANGVPDTQLRLLRLAAGPRETSPRLESRPLEPFLAVERTLQIGLDWRVSTTVRRLSPPDLPISLELPLLESEAVTTPGLAAKNGRLAVNLPPGEASLTWDSLVDKRSPFTLRAPETDLWTETWRVDVSPVWHMNAQGIAVVHHQDASGAWLPEWRPWPGEEVTLSFVRPTGAQGNTLTIDDSRLELSPGLRATDSALNLTIRTAQGTQHTLKLPEGAVLQTISIDGTSQPIRQQERAVTIPLHPGAQTIALSWRTETGIGARFQSPLVDLGAPSVNSRLHVSLGRDRWVLWVAGPQWGPAVLFWGMLVVIVGIALLLGRIPWTPLKTRSWLLLLIGLSQIHFAAALIVVAWLLALGQRAQLDPAIDDNRFNVIQLGLAFLTVLALVFLVHAVEQGLLGVPDMQIAGGGSSAFSLQWFQDRSAPELPRSSIVSAPLWVYRVAMLAWALWLALSLLDWLRWGWACFAAHGLWRRRKPVEVPPPAAGAVQPDPWAGTSTAAE